MYAWKRHWESSQPGPATASCNAVEARALIAERDRTTAKYLGDMFKVRPDDPQSYHLILNLGKWSLEAVAQIIVKAVEQLPAERGST